MSNPSKHINHNYSEETQEPESVPFELLSCCVPLIRPSFDEEEIFQIYGTAFLYNHRGQQYLITAYHCVWDGVPEEYLQPIIGFQLDNNPHRAYIVESRRIPEDSWIRDKRFDCAILPIVIEDEIKEAILPQGINHNNVLVNKEIARRIRLEGHLLGYGEGRVQYTHQVRREYLRDNGYDEREIDYLERRGYPTWIPYISKSYQFRVIEINDLFWVATVGLEGFSGGPVIYYDAEQFFCIGMILSSRVIKAFNQDTESEELYASGESKVVTMWRILGIIAQSETDTILRILRKGSTIVKIDYTGKNRFRLTPTNH